jgi:hypothetical protein
MSGCDFVGMSFEEFLQERDGGQQDWDSKAAV